VAVDGEELSLEAEIVLIASGSRPYRPASIPFDDPDVHDSEEILAIRRLPTSMAVVGGGAVGCEYASIFTALGTDVTLLDTADRLLPFMDEEISRLLAETFERMGMRLRLGGGVATVDRADEGLRVRLADGEPLHPEQVLFAAGRSGNTEGLGLEELGAELDARGRVKVDEHFRTSAEGIYAAGDVIGPPALASVSMEQGRVAVCHAFGIPFKETVDPLPPFAVYSIPEAAMVGLTEEAAQAQGVDHEVGRGWFAGNAKATISGFTEGLVKLVFRRENKALLGVHILGEGASELIHTGQAVMHAGGTIDRFIHTTFCAPTRTEAYKYAAYDGLQRLAGRSVDRDR
jgi:NAD(P) transhydrogenase